jgi:hypothetical protein
VHCRLGIERSARRSDLRFTRFGSNLDLKNARRIEDLGQVGQFLKENASAFAALPGFRPIPFEKIGLYVDAYRRLLPTDAEASRVLPKVARDGRGHAIWE